MVQEYSQTHVMFTPQTLTLSEKRNPRDLGSKVYLHYARIRVAEFLQFSHLILLRLTV